MYLSLRQYQVVSVSVPAMNGKVLRFYLQDQIAKTTAVASL